jgi:D-glycero-alpha-D-manno-heptose-7-phosphate kinase
MKKIILKSRAPIRLDLSGGWTDVPPFSSEVGGAVVSAAINRYTYATVQLMPSKAIKITSADYNTNIEVDKVAELQYDGKLDLIKAAIKRLKISKGINLYMRSDAPPNSGMGTSASAAVALIGLLNHLQNDKLSSHEIANLARLLEIEELNIAGGKQDQYSAAFGGINFMEFKDPVVSISQLRLADSTINELEKHLVLCYTGISRLSGNIISKVMNEYQRGVKKTEEALHAMKKIAIEMKIALLNGNVDKFGICLGENWKNQKKLHESVSNPIIDALFKIAYKHGAIGGKALGAGGGGCLLFYCETNTEHKVKKALRDQNMLIMDWNFEFKGLQIWENRHL